MSMTNRYKTINPTNGRYLGDIRLLELYFGNHRQNLNGDKHIFC